jgi:predicted benzoate:H+ symporter BenE
MGAWAWASDCIASWSATGTAVFDDSSTSVTVARAAGAYLITVQRAVFDQGDVRIETAMAS